MLNEYTQVMNEVQILRTQENEINLSHPHHPPTMDLATQTAVLRSEASAVT